MKNPSEKWRIFFVLWSLWFGILVTERWLVSVVEPSRSAPTKRQPKRRSIGTFLFTEKSRISTPLNDRDFFVRCRDGARSV